MNIDTETSPAPVDHLKPWLNACYGRVASLSLIHI